MLQFNGQSIAHQPVRLGIESTVQTVVVGLLFFDRFRFGSLHSCFSHFGDYRVIMATQRLRKRDKVHAMLLSLDPRNISLKEVICETWVVTHLAFELLYYLGSRLVWIWMFFRFLVYVSLLMVPFIRAGYVANHNP